jgi:hypothetical protein
MDMLRRKRLVIGCDSSGHRSRIGASNHQTPDGFEIFLNPRRLDLLQAIVKNAFRAFSHCDADCPMKRRRAVGICERNVHNIVPVHGAKGHISVLAVKISLRTSNGCAEPGHRKRTHACIIAVETVEAAHIQIRMRGSVGYLRHWVTAMWARMNFNSFR